MNKKMIFILSLFVIVVLIFILIHIRSVLKVSIIENRILKGELRYKGVIVLTYKIEYPEIIRSRYEFGKEAFNKYNRDKAFRFEQYVKTNLFKQAKDAYEASLANDYPIMVFEAIMQYRITYNSNYLVSLYYDEYQFLGGAHGSTIRTSQTWDLPTARQLPLEYFFQNNRDYKVDIIKEINRQIKEGIETGNNYYFEDYCQLVLDTFNTNNYYLSDKGIIVYFQAYDIGPYSSGILEFNIKKYRNP